MYQNGNQVQPIYGHSALFFEFLIGAFFQRNIVHLDVIVGASHEKKRTRRRNGN
jgi:hypothetical protein